MGSLQSGPQHANPMGTLHGGILCDQSDAAMGMAFARGKNFGYVECEVTDHDGKMIARTHSTCVVLRGDQANRAKKG